MTAELLASVAGIVLSLGFSYIPGLNTRFARLEGEHKRLIMVGMLVLVAGAVYGLSCTGWWPAVSCDQAGIQGLISAFVAALIANQGAYSLSPESKSVTKAKNGRYESPVG